MSALRSTESTDEGPWTAYQKWLVCLTALTIVFDGMDNQLLGITIPAFIADWHVSRSAFAPVVSLGYAGMMLGGAIAGFAGDRIGRRTALLGCLAIFRGRPLFVALLNTLAGLTIPPF